MIPQAPIDFVRATRNYYETDTHISAHASFIPNLPLREHPSSVLRWKSLDPSRLSPHCLFSGKEIFVGYSAQESGDLLDLGHLVCVDTGCFRGGWLTAPYGFSSVRY